MFFEENARAATHYVSASGNATWAQSTSVSTPCSVSTAFSKAIAGDTVYFRGGTYILGYGTQARPSLYPVHTGTKGNPITFKAYTGENPIFVGTITPKVTGIAGAGTSNYVLVDPTKDFKALGVVLWDILRTANTTKGGAAIKTVTNSTSLTFYNPGDRSEKTHNTLTTFQEGDYYEIGHDATWVIGLGPGLREYIIFDGLTVRATNSADGASELGGISLHSDVAAPNQGNQVKNCTVIGPEVKRIVHGDNREMLRVDDNSHTLIQKNIMYRLHNIKESYTIDTNTLNTSAFKSYHGLFMIIENNEIYDVATGIFLKGTSSDSIVRYNYVHDTKVGFIITPNTVRMLTDRVQIYHNIIANCSHSSSASGTLFAAGGGGDDADTHGNNLVIYNNTFYKTDPTGSAAAIVWGGSDAGHGEIFYNNIIIPLSQTYAFITTNRTDCLSTPHMKEADHNQWGATFKRIRISNYCNARNYDSLVAWKASTELESAVDVGCGSNRHPGCGDLSSDPKFVNGSGNMNQLADFRLAMNSPCKRAGRGGADMGANIDVVGILPK